MRDYFSARGWRVDLPELDLPPGDYRERKPKGWRWKLPIGHEDDVKLPFAMFFAVGGFLVYLVLSLDPELQPIVGGAAVGGFGVGTMFMLWTRR